MKKILVLSGLCIIIVLICGCSGPTQDEEFKVLIQNVSSDFQGQKDLIVNPTKGLTAGELRQYKSAATSAREVAGTLTLSDQYSKARGVFVQGMNATITAVDTLEQAGKVSEDGRIPTDSVNVYFISTQTKIDDTFNLIGIKR